MVRGSQTFIHHFVLLSCISVGLLAIKGGESQNQGGNRDWGKDQSKDWASKNWTSNDRAPRNQSPKGQTLKGRAPGDRFEKAEVKKIKMKKTDLRRSRWKLTSITPIRIE